MARLAPERKAREFTISPAERDNVPLLFSLTAPSGAGKTFSALRVAMGIREVTGGEIVGVDTEQKRMKHYADDFRLPNGKPGFHHVPFAPPFGSLDYLDAVRFAVKDHKARVCIIDSMSHEHDGDGGYLQTHDAELRDMGGDDKNNWTAWQRPARERRQFINGILQLDCAFIFCFRAKDKLKIGGKGTKPIELGWMPIAGQEFLFEMTAACILYPGALGMPIWRSNMPGESTMLKLPRQFQALFEEPRQLDEATGRALGTWATGGKRPESTMSEELRTLATAGEEAAAKGMAALQAWFVKLTGPQKVAIKPTLDAKLKPRAIEFEKIDDFGIVTTEPPAEEDREKTPEEKARLALMAGNDGSETPSTPAGDAKPGGDLFSTSTPADDNKDEAPKTAQRTLQDLRSPASAELQRHLAVIADETKTGALEGMLKYADDVRAELEGVKGLEHGRIEYEVWRSTIATRIATLEKAAAKTADKKKGGAQ